MTASSPLPYVLISVCCGALVGFAVLALTGRRASVSRRIGGFVGGNVIVEDKRTLVARALGDRQLGKIERSPRWARFQVELEISEMRIGAEQLLIASFALAAVIGFIAMHETASPLAFVLALGLVPFIVYQVVRWKADRRRRVFSEQLPDNLQVIASAMRAGQTFMGGLRAVLEDAPEPSRRELRRAVTDESLGIPLAEALEQVTERMNSEDFKHVAVVASLQRETGGNTAEVIDLVADTIRQRLEIRRMVRGLTAQGRLAGMILSFLPVGLLLMISMINPGYTHPLFHKTVGIVVLIIGVCLSGTGSFVINKIVNIKV